MYLRTSSLLLVLTLWQLYGVCDESPTFTAEQLEFFETNVRPVLVQHCYDCHSTDAKEVEAGLYVDSRDGILKGGDSGPAIVVGMPEKSELISAIKYQGTEMPPNRKLSQKDIDSLVRWVREGAAWPAVTTSPGAAVTEKEIDWEQAQESHWAWRSVEHPQVPEDVGTEGAVDHFVAQRLKGAGLQRNPAAEPWILVRRIYLDLIGILPTPQQVTRFVQAASVDRKRAAGELVDELLQSPLYGQRWARHWLDVARYSDGRGGFLDNVAMDNAWRYRDWVVSALNDDMPINRFIELQVAGDVVGDYHDAVATGFFAIGPTYRSDGGDPDSVAQARGETLDDRIDTLSRGLLGVTASCARCHDHKFDPIPQLDYYSLAGVFNNTGVHARPLADQEVVSRFNEHKKAVDGLNKQKRDLENKIKKEKREATEQEQANLADWTKQLEQLGKEQPPGYDTAHALHERGKADMHVALRGNLRKTGQLAPRRFLRILHGAEPQPFTSGSGRQELATAIISPDNPLTSRVFVNRVWMHHFGKALVRTPSNFGTLGQKPTHPKLLDWLASDFVAGGWSLKSLHRRIMNSETYLQSAAVREDAFANDADNRLVWRMNPRRMDVEAWRDSMLHVTAELDTSAEGPAIDDIGKSVRRTLYAKVSRNGDVFPSDRFLRRFDFPLMRATVAQRPSSVVPQQFLFLLNSPFMVARAEALSKRLLESSDQNTERIELAYHLLYCRLPTNEELQIGVEFLGRSDQEETKLSRWQRYCQTLLSANEFMYIR